jgi:hypothetical protein
MIIPLAQWQPVVFDRINRADARSPSNLLLAVAPLAVNAHPRYHPKIDEKTGVKSTWCNIFLWDATSALDAEIPHFYPEHILEGGKVKQQRGEFTALGMIGWLKREGPAQGWRSCTEAEARRRADVGFPTVVTWMNPKFSGGKPQPSHVALLLPSPINGPQLIAQAGAECLFGAPIERGFGDAKPLEYYTHE